MVDEVYDGGVGDKVTLMFQGKEQLHIPIGSFPETRD
jgi:hypothetical protein